MILQGSARMRQTCTQGAPPSSSKPQLKAQNVGLRRDQELLAAGLPEGFGTSGGLANPSFAFTPDESKVNAKSIGFF